MTKRNPIKIVNAYQKTVDYFYYSKEYSWIYELFYINMYDEDAENIVDNIESLLNINGRNYSYAYDYQNALFFIQKVQANSFNFLNMCIDYAFEYLYQDEELPFEYTGIDDVISLAYEEMHGDRYANKPALELICDINDIIITEAASFFVAQYEENLIKA